MHARGSMYHGNSYAPTICKSMGIFSKLFLNLVPRAFGGRDWFFLSPSVDNGAKHVLLGD